MKHSGDLSILALTLCVILAVGFLSVPAVAAVNSGWEVPLPTDGGAPVPGVSQVSVYSTINQQPTGGRDGGRGCVMPVLIQKLRKAFLPILRQYTSVAQQRCDAVLREIRTHAAPEQTEQPTNPPAPTNPTNPSTSSRGSGLMTADDNDVTGFTPQNWSWTAEGEG